MEDVFFFQASVVPMEEKLNQAQVEVQQLKSSVRNYEGLIETYKSQVGILSRPSALAQTCFLPSLLWLIL